MEYRNVNSSNIKQIGYDMKKRVLRIIFHSGAVYDYTDVDQNVYSDFISAPSIGKYFSVRIKNAYPYVRKI